MTESLRFPPARERYRHGMRPFTIDPPLSQGEALIDKVFITLRGSITAREEGAIRDFAALVSTSPTSRSLDRPRLFGAGHWNGRKFVAPIVNETTITSGELAILQRGAGARIDMTLSLNPTRTLGHLLERHTLEDIERLSPSEFFTPSPDPVSARISLDRRDNMVSDFLVFSGTTHRALVERIARYLETYEAALQSLILQELCPSDQGYEYVLDQGDVVASNDDYAVRLDWSRLSVGQCEACWERFHPDALSTVQTLADDVLTAARSGGAHMHLELDGGAVERCLGALSVRVPLVSSGKVQLVVYAKAADRVRIEVRYLEEMSQDVRDLLQNGPQRLVGWFDAVRRDATPRVPWEALHRLMEPSNDPTVDALIDLVDAVAAVTSRVRESGRPCCVSF